MVLFATTRFDKAREPVGSTMHARYVKLTLPCTTIGPVGEGDALDEDEVEDTTKDDAVAEPEVVVLEAKTAAAEEAEVGVIEAKPADEVEFDTNDEEPITELPELLGTEELGVAATALEMVDEVEFAANTCVVGALNLYIWRRLPAPQYSVALPGQSMLQSAWFGTKALPAFGLDPQ